MEASLFDLKEAREREAHRRLQLLGDLVHQPYCYDLLRKRATTTLVPTKVLWTWWQAYQKRGLDGLSPTTWEPLDEATQETVATRYADLREVVDTIEFASHDIDLLTSRKGWSDRTCMRWVMRYRIGGLWGLAPQYNPEGKQSHSPLPPQRSWGTLDDAACYEMERRLWLLGEELLMQEETSRQAVLARAQEKGVSERTLWNYLKAYRDYGILGLAPRLRSDKHEHHGISDRMVETIQGLRLSKEKLNLATIQRQASQIAHHLGEPEPSPWQVRMICAAVPKSDQLLAQGRENEFRDKYAITWDMTALKMQDPRIIYEIDHTLVDVLVKDLRSEKYRTASGEVRPWITLCIDRRSRLIMAAIFSYDKPDRHTVAAAIRDAVLITEHKPYGGVPDEIWVDNGKELLSGHIQQLTQHLKVILHRCKLHCPQEKGTVERFFGTFNTRLWSTLPGYVSSNTVERNPSAKAVLTIAELETRFHSFVGQYHQEEHSQLSDHQTPLSYWKQHCYALSVDPRQLDLLLLEAESRYVAKSGIRHRNTLYWHQALANYIGKYCN
jgi:putative transposase